MASIKENFSGKWMVAADVPMPRGIKATITEITEEQVKNKEGKTEIKLVLWLHGHEKGLILNKTNGNVLGKIFGDETDDWAGKKVALVVEKVQYMDKRMDGIRVDEEATRAALRNPLAPSKKPATPVTQAEADEDWEEGPAY